MKANSIVSTKSNTNTQNVTTAYRQALRTRILDMAMQEFSRHGVRAVKMDDLAQALSISKRTLYELYSNKEDLLFEGIRKYHALQLEENTRIVESSGNVMDTLLMLYQHSVAQLRAVNPLFYTDLERYPRIVDYLRAESQRRLDGRKAFIRRGMDEGYFRRDVNIDLALHVFEILSTHMVREGVFSLYSIDDIYNSVVFLMLRGLCTERGVRRIDQFMHC